MYPINNLIQFPSGRWGFVGRVSPQLSWKRKDDTSLTKEDIETLHTCQMPGWFYKTVSFETKQAAIEAAKELNVEYTE